MKHVTITWKARDEQPEASVEFEIGNDVPDAVLCELAYRDSQYGWGLLWKRIRPLLSSSLTRIQLSEGDEIKINGALYVRKSQRWIQI